MDRHINHTPHHQVKRYFHPQATPAVSEKTMAKESTTSPIKSEEALQCEGAAKNEKYQIFNGLQPAKELHAMYPAASLEAHLSDRAISCQAPVFTFYSSSQDHAFSDDYNIGRPSVFYPTSPVFHGTPCHCITA